MTTIEHIKGFLDEWSLKYVSRTEDSIGIGFKTSGMSCDQYEGRSQINIFVRLQENGGFLSICAHPCWNISKSPYRSVVLEAFLEIMSKYKAIRFDLDSNGDVRPNVEIPIEDSSLTCLQFHRALGCILGCIDVYHPAIVGAMEKGVLSFDSAVGGIKDLADEIGIDALRRLL